MSNSTATSSTARAQWIALAVLALPCMLVTMDLTVLFLAVPKLTASLQTSATELLWITDVYGFVIAGALVVREASATGSDADASFSPARRRSQRHRCWPLRRQVRRC